MQIANRTEYRNLQRTLQIAPNIANCTEHRKLHRTSQIAPNIANRTKRRRSHQVSSAILKHLISSSVANCKSHQTSQIARNIANRTEHRKSHQVSSAILNQLISSSGANCKSHQTSQVASILKQFAICRVLAQTTRACNFAAQNPKFSSPTFYYRLNYSRFWCTFACTDIFVARCPKVLLCFITTSFTVAHPAPAHRCDLLPHPAPCSYNYHSNHPVVIEISKA